MRRLLPSVGLRLQGRWARAIRTDAAADNAMPADFAILPPFPRGNWRADVPAPADVETPRTMSTTLPSGLRVVSQETYTHMCALGVVVEAGSAHEVATLGTRGVAHLAEVMAWRGTYRRTQAELLRDVESFGGYLHANVQREQTLYCVDALREHAAEATRALAESLLMPRIDPTEVEAAKEHMRLAWEDAPQDQRVRELIHEAAYGSESPLGASLLCKPADIGRLDAMQLLEYRSKLFLPSRTVVAGAGIGHEELVALAREHFEPLMPPPPATAAAAPRDYDCTYTGGVARCEEEVPQPAGFAQVAPTVRVAVAFEAGGWHSEDLIPLCVLQTLLGGGDSFSAGGPGKGMYSRLYREVLNRQWWVEGCESFVSIHANTGLIGIIGACPAEDAGKLVRICLYQLMRLGHERVSDVELQRAKNMLKCNVLTQLESRLVLFEDLSRQFSTFNKRQPLSEMCAKVDAVSAEDIIGIATKMLAKPPSIAAHGPDLSHVPNTNRYA